MTHIQPIYVASLVALSAMVLYMVLCMEYYSTLQGARVASTPQDALEKSATEEITEQQIMNNRKN